MTFDNSWIVVVLIAQLLWACGNYLDKYLIEKYGIDHYMKTIECQDKARKTKTERYGDEYFANIDKGKLVITNNNPFLHSKRAFFYPNNTHLDTNCQFVY